MQREVSNRFSKARMTRFRDFRETAVLPFCRKVRWHWGEYWNTVESFLLRKLWKQYGQFCECLEEFNGKLNYE